MKKLILICALSCSLCILNSYGQPERGTYILGGNAYMIFGFSSGSNSFDMVLSPNMGYFISDNLAIGASLPLSIRTSESYRFFGYGITPFLRYYFGQPSDIMYFFTGAFGIRGYSSKYNDTSSSSSAITASAGLGGTYFLNKSIGLEAILGYTYDKWSESDPASSVGLSIGFQIYFSR